LKIEDPIADPIAMIQSPDGAYRSGSPFNVDVDS